jgi:glutamate-1-semialdehyde 2,1-aminomutase
MDKTQELYERAGKVIPGGVTAAARLNKFLGRPFYVSRAEGSRVYDLDGRPYIDVYTGSGAGIMGHGHPRIKEALAKAAEMGIACAWEYPEETELAEKLCAAVPSAEMVRFTLSGTENTWYAVRLARVYTGKTKMIKMEGHFHGFNDYLQYNYWPASGKGLPNLQEETPGFPPESKEHVIVLPFNDIEAVERTIAEEGDDIAGIILEPVNYNSGCILPKPGYLEALRRLTSDNNILLIFDEILSGFKTGKECVQGYYGVTPDVTTLGKALGGGVPLSAYVGRREVMETVAPVGAMMHSGTYNANSTNIYCGNAFMDFVGEPGAYAGLLSRSERLYAGLNNTFVDTGLPARAEGLGARFGLLFGQAAAKAPENYKDVATQDWEIGRAFFREAFDRGVIFTSGWHHGLSFAHTDDDVEEILQVTREAAAAVVAKRGG